MYGVISSSLKDAKQNDTFSLVKSSILKGLLDFIQNNIRSFLYLCRRRLSVRIQELEDNCEQLRVRCNSLEKTKNKLTAEIREITIELENVCIL